tara:strand:- start:77 stop:508 length:432 start_codon:yes stop_codon:yes gene_type:complete
MSITSYTIVILVLSLFFNSCCCKEPDLEREYHVSYQNSTDQSVQLVIDRGATADSFNITSGLSHLIDETYMDNANSPINAYVDILSSDYAQVKLYANNALQQTWQGPGRDLEDSVNTPFNYNSWQTNSGNSKITFSIKQEDID